MQQPCVCVIIIKTNSEINKDQHTQYLMMFDDNNQRLYQRLNPITCPEKEKTKPKQMKKKTKKQKSAIGTDWQLQSNVVG